MPYDFTTVYAPRVTVASTAKRKAGALSQAPIYNPVTGLLTSYSSDPSTAAMLGLAQKDSSVGEAVPVVGAANYAPTAGATTKTDADPNKDFTPLRATKNPDIAAAANIALKDATASADATAKSYQDYLAEAKAQQAANQKQLASDRATFNDTTDYAKQLADAEARYAATEGATNQQIRQSNADFQKAQQTALDELRANNAQYETAAQAVADQAVARADAGNKLYQTVSGTPTSDSGQMRSRAIKAYEDVNVPLQADLANRRAAIVQNVEMPLNAAYRGNEVQRLEGFQGPMYGTEANMSVADANAVEQLKVALAGRGLDESLRYMQSLGVPLQVQQAVLSGSLANIGTAANLVAGNEFYGLSTPYQNPGLTLPDYNPGNPPLHAPNNYVAPVTYGPSTPGTANPAIAGAPRSNQLAGTKQANGFTVTGSAVERLARQIYASNLGVDPATDPNYAPDAYRQAFQQALTQLGPATAANPRPRSAYPATNYPSAEMSDYNPTDYVPETVEPDYGVTPSNPDAVPFY